MLAEKYPWASPWAVNQLTPEQLVMYMEDIGTMGMAPDGRRTIKCGSLAEARAIKEQLSGS